MSGRTTCIEHHVAEGWEELDRGICPACGTPVSWDAGTDRWVPDPGLVVLVVDIDAVSELIPDPYTPTPTQELVGRQVGLYYETLCDDCGRSYGEHDLDVEH
jgi:hypothetical protein